MSFWYEITLLKHKFTTNIQSQRESLEMNKMFKTESITLLSIIDKSNRKSKTIKLLYISEQTLREYNGSI
jgi:hypothetical protein